MDNRVFNVNGKGLEMLIATLQLAFSQEGRNTTAKAYTIDPEKGLILLWYIPDSKTKKINPFLVPLSAEAVAVQVMEWLKTDGAWETKLDHWDEDCDHDGHNTKGWRVYCEDWGHVGTHHNAIVAIKPAYMWHGK